MAKPWSQMSEQERQTAMQQEEDAVRNRALYLAGQAVYGGKAQTGGPGSLPLDNSSLEASAGNRARAYMTNYTTVMQARAQEAAQQQARKRFLQTLLPNQRWIGPAVGSVAGRLQVIPPTSPAQSQIAAMAGGLAGDFGRFQPDEANIIASLLNARYGQQAP